MTPIQQIEANTQAMLEIMNAAAFGFIPGPTTVEATAKLLIDLADEAQSSLDFKRAVSKIAFDPDLLAQTHGICPALTETTQQIVDPNYEW